MPRLRYRDASGLTPMLTLLKRHIRVQPEWLWADPGSTTIVSFDPGGGRGENALFYVARRRWIGSVVCGQLFILELANPAKMSTSLYS